MHADLVLVDHSLSELSSSLHADMPIQIHCVLLEEPLDVC